MKKMTLAEIQEEEEKRRLIEQAQIQAILEQQAAETARVAREGNPSAVWGAPKAPVAVQKLSLREIQEQVCCILLTETYYYRSKALPSKALCRPPTLQPSRAMYRCRAVVPPGLRSQPLQSRPANPSRFVRGLQHCYVMHVRRCQSQHRQSRSPQLQPHKVSRRPPPRLKHPNLNHSGTTQLLLLHRLLSQLRLLPSSQRPKPPSMICIDAFFFMHCRPTAAKLIEVKSTQSSPTPAFVSWCQQQLSGFSAAIDVQSFVSFLWEVEAESDIKSFASEVLIGSSGNIFAFVREFVDRRKAIVHRQSTGDVAVVDDDEFQVKSSAKSKKNKFTKAPVSLLNFKTEPPPPLTDQ
jgi:hypothetical protein